MNPTAPAIEPEDYRRLVGFKLLLLAILGAATYLNSLNGAFLIGDQFQTTFNFAVEQGSASINHMLHIALHTLAALGLYGVVCRTLIRQHSLPRLQEAAPWLAFLSALLWMVHPLNTETVDYLSRRGDLLAGLFTIVTLYCIIRGADGVRGWLWYGAALLACFLGMGSALTAFAAPVLVLLYDRIYLADSWRELWRRRAGLYIGLASCWILLAASILLFGYSPRAIVSGTSRIPVLTYALAQPGVILHDLGLVFWPLGVCFDYFDWPLDQPAGAYVLPFVVVGALLAATVWVLVRRPKVGFLGAWFFLTLAPTSSFIPQTDAAGDYRMYLPLAAVSVLVVLAGFALVQWAGERAPWAAYAAVFFALLAAGALGYTTFRRNADYENDLTILADTAAKRPGNVWAQTLLGGLYQTLGDPSRQAFGDSAGDLKKERSDLFLSKAAAAYQAVLNAPDTDRNAKFRGPARDSLVYVLLLSNRADELLQLITDGHGAASDRARELKDIGFNFWVNSNPDVSANAVKFFAEAARLQPETPKHHFNLALALLDKGDKEAAEAERKKGLELDPTWPKTARELAWKKATDADPGQRNPLQAIFLARQACQDGAQNPESLDALAAAYAAAGRFKEAAAEAELAVKSAEAEHNAALAQDIRQRLSLYKERRPFVRK